MTDRKQALQQLREKVAAGDAQGFGGNADFSKALGYTTEAGNAYDAFHGSLDAAKAMHEAVLPGWSYYDHLRRGLRYTSHIGMSIEGETFHASSDTPSRAWLLAILDALIAQAPDQ